MSSHAIADRGLTLNTAQAPLSIALRNLILTFALALTSLALAGFYAGSNGYEMLIVTMGWPHIILGFLSNFGKVIRGETRTRSSFLLLALLTLVLWTLHYSYMITGFISIYFTYHVFRDEVFIYFQTRARHKLRDSVYVAGLIPFILLMFFVTDPRPQHYRQDLRRVELGATQLSASGWTLITFDPISYSSGQSFYFYLEAPHLKGPSSYNTLASLTESRIDGEIRVADRLWDQASDLVFKPWIANDNEVAPPQNPDNGKTIPVLVSGDYRLGQTFKAERENLAGIWVPILRSGTRKQAEHFVFHLTQDTSVPLAPLTPTMQRLRHSLLVILVALVLWKALPRFKQNRIFWVYFAIFIAIFAVLQKGIRADGGADFELPVMFQLIVVFHYWSWYVFSFDKLRAISTVPPCRQSIAMSAYGRLLLRLRNVSTFTVLVVGLNLLSAAGVLWYSKLNGPAPLRFVFDYSYFLYFLVFHVTFSFAPKQTSQNPQLRQRA